MSDKRYPTRMHEVLGVEPHEPFEVKGHDGKFILDSSGAVRFGKHFERSAYSEFVAEIINNPERITRRPRLTEEQEYVLKALYVAFDFKWVAKQEDGQVMAFEDKPQKHKDYFSGETQWYCGEGEEEKDYGWKVKPSSPICGLVSWSDPEPLDIVQTLKDNGISVEVE